MQASYNAGKLCAGTNPVKRTSYAVDGEWSPHPSIPTTTSGGAPRRESSAAISRAKFLRGSRVPTNKTNRSGRSYVARTRARSASVMTCVVTPSGTCRSRSAPIPAATQSSKVACDEHNTIAAFSRTMSRLRRKTLFPRGVKNSG
ncbi:unannotated protein [freshwater metagenome]|uniref:Unannotated protein n=1 Tax=freshwater metagenome TaxID=449393 RepID=A0A6J6V0P8_9ZZZZ